MPDHLHAIIAFPRDPGMETTVKNWKKFAAGKHGVDWQRDFFDHRLRDHHELDEKSSYILMNPVRKGLSERRIGSGFIIRMTVRRRVGRAGGPLLAVHSRLRRRARSEAPYLATRLISSSDAGFSNADVSPSFSPR